VFILSWNKKEKRRSLQINLSWTSEFVRLKTSFLKNKKVTPCVMVPKLSIYQNYSDFSFLSSVEGFSATVIIPKLALIRNKLSIILSSLSSIRIILVLTILVKTPIVAINEPRIAANAVNETGTPLQAAVYRQPVSSLDLFVPLKIIQPKGRCIYPS
jgi:hypothetical protein